MIRRCVALSHGDIIRRARESGLSPNDESDFKDFIGDTYLDGQQLWFAVDIGENWQKLPEAIKHVLRIELADLNGASFIIFWED